MENFQVGFARGDITPPIGAGLTGAFVRRLSTEVLDPLLASVLALSDGEERVLLISLDNLGIEQIAIREIKEGLTAATAIPSEHIFIHCTHTHSANALTMGPKYQADFVREVFDEAVRVIVDTAKEALSDLAPAEAFVNACDTPIPISFIRRYKMKDGSIKTNPGWLHPDIDYPLGEADHRVALTLLKREGKPEIALINFQTHPCVVADLRISADYPCFLRETYEAVIPNARCMFINGAQGDSNHIDVTETPDLPRHGLERARHMGRTIAATAISLYALCRKIETLPLRAFTKPLMVPHNKETAEERIAWALHTKKLHDEGRFDELCPEGGMMLNTLIGEATRILRMKDAPDEKELTVSGLRFGDFALVGFPGEPFTEIGRQVKAASPSRMTYIACCANGYEGYYPMQSAYDEGGYEAKTSPYRAGVAECLIEAGKEMLKTLFPEE